MLQRMASKSGFLFRQGKSISYIQISPPSIAIKLVRDRYYSFLRFSGKKNIIDDLLLSAGIHSSVLVKVPVVDSKTIKKEWQDPSFMVDEVPKKKERWLRSLLDASNVEEDSTGGVTIDYHMDQNVDATAYHVVIKGWAESGLSGAPQKAEEWICRLERHYHAAQNMNFHVEDNSMESHTLVNALEPTTSIYNSVIETWSRSKSKHSKVRAERWISKMKTGINNGNHSIQPNTKSYNLFLDILSRGDEKKPTILHKNSEQALSTLREMIKEHVEPDTDSFNFVIRAITRCKKDPLIAVRVMKLIREMEDFHQISKSSNNSLVRPNTMSFCMAMDAWGIVAGQKARAVAYGSKGHNSKSRSRCDNYSSVNAYLTNAENILRYMHKLQDDGDKDVIVNAIAYNTIITAYTRVSNEKNPDAPLLAENIYRKMIDRGIKPDRSTYQNLIRTWTKTKCPTSGDRAKWWLRKMSNESKTLDNDHLQPNVNTYNAVLETYLNIGEASKAETLFLEQLEFEKHNEGIIRVNSETFSLIIRTWLKYAQINEVGNSIKGCRQAHKWLTMLLQREKSGIPFCSSSPELFGTILKVIAKARENDYFLFDIALKTFSKLKSSRHHVDALSYQCLLQIGLKSIASPLDNRKREKFIHQVVTSCCEDGLVSSGFVSTFSQYFSSTLRYPLQETQRQISIYFGDFPIPKNCSRNLNKNKAIVNAGSKI